MPGPERDTLLDGIAEAMKKAGLSYERLGGDGGSLVLDTPETDCLVELSSDGRFACQFGVDMGEMRNLLTGEQTEDMADDELVRVARYHLKTIVDRYRSVLLQEGLEEAVDATEHYYAIAFRTQLDLSDPQKALHHIARYLLAIEKRSR